MAPNFISKLILTLFLTIGLAACSSLKILYNFADDYIKQEATFFLNFDEQGMQDLTDKVDKMMKWHNTIMLPHYAAYLNHQANQLELGLYNAQAVAKGMRDGLILIKNTIGGGAPYVASVLVHHTNSENIEHLRLQMLIRIKEKNETFEQPVDQRIENRKERLKKNLKRFMGNLNEKQTKLINRYAKVTVNDARRRLTNRTLRQSALLTFLTAKPSEMEIDTFVRQILLRPYEIVDPGYKVFSEERIDLLTILLANILAASTQDQRTATVYKLRSYAQDLVEISN